MDSNKADFIFTRGGCSSSQSVTLAYLGTCYLPHVVPLNLVQLKKLNWSSCSTDYYFQIFYLSLRSIPGCTQWKSMLLQRKTPSNAEDAGTLRHAEHFVFYVKHQHCSWLSFSYFSDFIWFQKNHLQSNLNYAGYRTVKHTSLAIQGYGI